MGNRIMIVMPILWCLAAASASASGHGPVFGAATPTLGKGGWSFDQAWMGARVGDADAEQVLRTMLGFGITKDVQVSVSLPVELTRSDRTRMGRMMATMSSRRDAEVLAAWRVHTRPVADTARLETTIYLGATAPLERRRNGVPTAPTVLGTIASGYASRAHYFWLGAGYQRPLPHGDDGSGDVTTYSVVYGYRPAALRLDYPKPDLRFFVEAVGESTAAARTTGAEMTHGAGHTLMVGPTALLLYKAYGVSGGVLLPVYQRIDGSEPRERLRFAINVSYFFWTR